jgi:CRP/FNR family transcriptional regulator
VRRITEISSFSLVRNLEKNDYLFREGEPCEGFFVVQRGVINVHRVNAAGKVQVTSFIPVTRLPRPH